MLTSQEDMRRFSLDSDSSHNLRQSVDSIDSEMEITNAVSYADAPPVLFNSSENVGDVELSMDVDGDEDNLEEGEGEGEGEVDGEEGSQNSEESEDPVDDDSESMDSAQDVAVDDASSESKEAGLYILAFQTPFPPPHTAPPSTAVSVGELCAPCTSGELGGHHLL